MTSRTPSRLLVIGFALVWRLWTLGRRRPAANPQRILIAHHLLLGDTLMLTPLLAKLRERYPASEIIMTVPKAIYPLYQKRPYGVIVRPYDRRAIKTLWDLLKTAGYDLAIVPGDNRYSWLAAALGACWIVAFAGDRPACKNWPVDELIPYPATPATWGDMVAGLIKGDAPAPYRPEAWPDPDCASFNPPPSPYCVLHVGARAELRLWPNDNWRELAAHLTQLGFRIVWSSGPGEEQYVSAIDPDGRHSSYAGELNLAQLWHLFKHAQLVVCPDTGVAHLGRLIGVPTVTIFGPGSAVLFGAGDFWKHAPYRAVTIADFHCRDQRMLFKRRVTWMRHCSRSPRECQNNLCMQAVGTDKVIRAITELLKKD